MIWQYRKQTKLPKQTKIEEPYPSAVVKRVHHQNHKI